MKIKKMYVPVIILLLSLVTSFILKFNLLNIIKPEIGVGTDNAEPIRINSEIIKSEDFKGGTKDNFDKVVLETKALLFNGRIIDWRTQEGIREYNIAIFRYNEIDKGFTTIVYEGINKQQSGIFNVAIPEYGKYILKINAEGYLQKTSCVIELNSQNDLCGFEMMLIPTGYIQGRVLDEETLAPIEGAVVGIVRYLRSQGQESELISKSITERDGKFTLELVTKTESFIVAYHPQYMEGHLKVDYFDSPLEIKLSKYGSIIYGKLYYDKKILKYSKIEIQSDKGAGKREVMVNESGEYRSPPLPSGKATVVLTVRDSEEESKELREEKKVLLSDNNEIEVNFGTNDEYAAWTGFIIGWDGNTIAYGELVLDSAQLYSNYSFDDDKISTFTNKDGKFSIRNIPLGNYTIYLATDSNVRHFKYGMMEFKDAKTYINDINFPHTSISGTIIDGMSGGPANKWEVSAQLCGINGYRTYEAYTDKDGSFRLVGLPIGEYVINIRAQSRAVSEIYWQCPRVDLEESSVAHLEITYPTYGMVNLEIDGLSELSGKNVKILLYFENNKQACSAVYIPQKANLVYEDKMNCTLAMAVGNWKIKIWMQDDVLCYESGFKVYDNDNADVNVNLH